MKKAWRVTFNGIDSIEAAETRGKAHAMAWNVVHEFYDKAVWGDIQVRRAPKYDLWAELDATEVGWDPDLLPGGKYNHDRSTGLVHVPGDASS